MSDASPIDRLRGRLRGWTTLPPRCRARPRLVEWGAGRDAGRLNDEGSDLARQARRPRGGGPRPAIQEPTDAIVRITSTNICGSDLHLYETLGPFMGEGDILGHEPMGIVEEVGSAVTTSRSATAS